MAESGPAKEMADESDDEGGEDQVRGYPPGCRGVHACTGVHPMCRST